ncbi:unnamed protein product [Chrysoparadoxa australica]
MREHIFKFVKQGNGRGGMDPPMRRLLLMRNQAETEGEGRRKADQRMLLRCCHRSLPRVALLGQCRTLSSKPAMSLIKELRERSGAPITDCKNSLQESEGDIQKAFEWLRKRGMSKASTLSDRTANEGLVGVKVEGGRRRAALVEVNSETDFVARNELFQGFVNTVSATALEAPVESGPIDVDSLLQLQVPGSSCTLQDTLADTVGSIRENIQISSAQVVSVSSGLIGTYVHGSPAPNMGKAGAVVALECLGCSDASALPSQMKEGSGKALAMHIVAAKPKFLHPESVPEEVIEKERVILEQMAQDSGKPAAVVEKMVEGRIRKFMAENTLMQQEHMVAEGGGSVASQMEGLAKEIGSTITVTGFARKAVGEGGQ